MASTNEGLLAYIGGYTGPKSHGIYLSRFDPGTGRLSPPELAAEARNPSFLAVHPRRRILYAVGEIDDFGGKPAGSVSAFQIENISGKLTLLNQKSSGGTGPCHLAVDATGKCVLVANYNNGTVAVLPIQTDGSLGQPTATIQHQGASVNPQRQTGPHAHFIAPDPANRFVLACDLGLDKVLVYQFDPNRASLNPNDFPFASLPPGSGPRHLVFHPNGREAYVINEMASTLAVFSYNEKQGALTQVQIVSTLPASFKGENTCAEVQIHPSGKFVYGSNRGHDSIVAFAADPKTGKLTLIGHQSTAGRTPRHFALDPSGKWLLAENEGSNTIVTFAVNAKTGKLRATGASVEAGSPACLEFAPATSF